MCKLKKLDFLKIYGIIYNVGGKIMRKILYDVFYGIIGMVYFVKRYSVREIKKFIRDFI